jgi:hypothetical protein
MVPRNVAAAQYNNLLCILHPKGYLEVENIKLSSPLNPVAMQSKAWVCGHSLGMQVRSLQGHVCLSLVSVVCCQRSVRRTDHSSGGVQPSVVCLSVIISPRQWGGLDPLGLLPMVKKILVVRTVASGLSRDIITTTLKKIKGRILSLSYLKEKF